MSVQFVGIHIRGIGAGIVGALVVCVYFCVVLPRVTGVSCTFGADCIEILCFASTGSREGQNCFPNFCWSREGWFKLFVHDSCV